jgi:prepilin-type N-terminal cleavage/methylation domain-containing protein
LRKAFTLIELLVVIAIISILAAIIFPVFARARDKARQATCQSNLSQIGLAFMQYTQDNNEDYPCSPQDTQLWQGQRFRWPIMPYLAIGQTETANGYTSTGGPNSAAILHCPADTETSYDNTSYAYSAAFYYSPAQDSQLKTIGDLTSIAPADGPPSPQTDAEVTFPAQKILAGEWDDNHDGLHVQYSWWSNVTTWHEYLFADGHVQYIPTSQMTTGYDGYHDPNVTLGGIGGQDIL